MIAVPCRFLEWDSEFFSRRVARVDGERLTPETVDAIEAWCEQQRIDCLYFLADSNDPRTVALAEACGFHFVDIRLTMGRRLDGPGAEQDAPAEVDIDLPVAADLPVLRAIARDSHRVSRFFFDARFPDERCEALYERWIAQSCEGYADAVFVARRDRLPLGYITCHRSAVAGTVEIGLLGVVAAARGKGVGRRLVNAALDWARMQPETGQVVTVTQGRNVGAQQLYQRCGFRTTRVRLWYHRWFEV